MTRKPNDTLDHEDFAQDEVDAMLRSDFSLFAQATFGLVNQGVPLQWAPYLDLICATLQAVAEGKIRHLIITLPPRHLKSFCVSAALPAFVLGHDPTKQVMAVSYGQELSKTFGEQCQKIMLSPLYQRLFGRVLVGSRQAPSLLKTARGGLRRATSLDGAATGVGADLLIFDDPQKPGETLSETMRRASNEHYERTFLSRRNNPATAAIIIVMQRLHEDDFVSHVLSLGGNWHVLNLPALAEEDECFPYETVFGAGVFRRPAGQALHPDRVSEALLQEIREDIGEAAYAGQYQQRPAPIGGGLVKGAWFKRYSPDQLPARFDRIIQSWDTANKIEDWHDFSVCTTWGVKDKEIWLLDLFRERLEYPELKRSVVAQARRWSPSEIHIEDKASGTQLLQELKHEQLGHLRAAKPVQDKRMRMSNQTGIIEAGRVHVPAEAPWLQDYLYELEVFPNGKFDDQVDSTAQALDVIHQTFKGQGIFEFYRQEAERLKSNEEEIFVLTHPNCNRVYGREGVQYSKGSDGCFRIPAADARPLLGLIGWARIRDDDG